MSTQVTSKGQVTIPKNIRELLKIKPGAAIDFVLNAHNEVVLKPAKHTSSKTVSRFAKARGTADITLHTDEIMALLRN